MSSEIAIRCEGLSKRYRIGQQERYKALRDVISDAAAAPFRRLRHAISGNGHNHASPFALRPLRSDTIWALDDVSFEIKRGEVVGVIGRNGAGKSTLLKILSRITKPTRGSAEIHGRVSSLLEVGTGFHPELTGRENLYLNGAILGMRKAEIDRKFDEIVAFAEVEKFIDTPVKRYSSGMQVRLAFAVAAHLQPEILLVDEVLAVGDAAFQKKCLGKMGEVANQGRTVLFVTHNMTAVTQLCRRAILLDSGVVLRDGAAPEVISSYLSGNGTNSASAVWPDQSSAPGGDTIRIHAVRVLCNGQVSEIINIDQPVVVQIEFWNLSTGIENLYADIYLLDNMGITVLSSPSTPSANLLKENWFGKPHPPGLFRSTCTIPPNFLNDGRYFIHAFVSSFGPTVIHAEALRAVSFEVFDTGVMREAGGGPWHGVVRPRLAWTTDFVESLHLENNPAPDKNENGDRVAPLRGVRT
jgi:lipopolysaccharide transport system ATP-binding protein